MQGTTPFRVLKKTHRFINKQLQHFHSHFVLHSRMERCPFLQIVLGCQRRFVLAQQLVRVQTGQPRALHCEMKRCEPIGVSLYGAFDKRIYQELHYLERPVLEGCNMEWRSSQILRPCTKSPTIVSLHQELDHLRETTIRAIVLLQCMYER